MHGWTQGTQLNQSELQRGPSELISLMDTRALDCPVWR